MWAGGFCWVGLGGSRPRPFLVWVATEVAGLALYAGSPPNSVEKILRPGREHPHAMTFSPKTNPCLLQRLASFPSPFPVTSLSFTWELSGLFEKWDTSRKVRRIGYRSWATMLRQDWCIVENTVQTLGHSARQTTTSIWYINIESHTLLSS